MRKIGLLCFTLSAAATSGSAATASNLYSASISEHCICVQGAKNRLDLQVVGDDLLADLQGEKGLIEGEGNSIRQAHATNSDDALALCHRELARYGRVGSHNFFADHAGRRLSPRACISSTNPLSSVSSCVSFGAATNVPLPRRISTRPRLTRF